MFMADFEEAFFLATAAGPSVGDTVAVRRHYPGAWEVYRRRGPEVSNVLSVHRCERKPPIADVLAAENKRVKPQPARRRRRTASN
jgi:hypothetical protein